MNYRRALPVMSRREDTNKRWEAISGQAEVARRPKRKSDKKRRQQGIRRARRLAREEGCRSWEHERMRARTGFEVGGDQEE